MGLREKAIESMVTRTISHFGGKAYKWVSPMNKGVPDRICFLPGGLVIAIEVKAPMQTTRKLQKKVIKDLRAMGHEVLVIENSKEATALYHRLKEFYHDTK